MRVKCLAQEHNSTRPLPGLENIVLCCLRIVNTQVNSERKTPSNFLIMICNFESKERQYKICKMHVLLFGKYFFTSSWFRAILRSVLQISYISFKNVARNLVQKTIASRPKPLSPFCPRCFLISSSTNLLFGTGFWSWMCFFRAENMQSRLSEASLSWQEIDRSVGTWSTIIGFEDMIDHRSYADNLSSCEISSRFPKYVELVHFTSLVCKIQNARAQPRIARRCRWFPFCQRSMPLLVTKPFRMNDAISALV